MYNKSMYEMLCFVHDDTPMANWTLAVIEPVNKGADPNALPLANKPTHCSLEVPAAERSNGNTLQTNDQSEQPANDATSPQPLCQAV